MPLVLSGDGAVGPLSATEVSYLDGVTSAVQTQLNGKAATPGAWTDYTPVLTASTTNPTLGTGATQVGEYVQIGKIVIYRFNITFGSSGAAAGSGNYRISLPVTSKSYANTRPLGSGWFSDASASTLYNCVPVLSVGDTTYINMLLSYGGGAIQSLTAAAPVVPAASDQIVGSIIYEAA